jgi:NADH:ubiquinone oxidoreductase subunit 3 (subunit A)
MENLLLVPPVAFVLVLLISYLFAALCSVFELKSANNPPGKFKAYACGEDVQNHRVSPDYNQFFPFAFFFTIMHVLALIVATVPKGAIKSSGIVALYIISAICGLLILYRKQD